MRGLFTRTRQTRVRLRVGAWRMGHAGSGQMAVDLSSTSPGAPLLRTGWRRSVESVNASLSLAMRSMFGVSIWARLLKHIGDTCSARPDKPSIGRGVRQADDCPRRARTRPADRERGETVA